MKSAYHYFPFIFISFLLYAVFFYFHEDLLPSNQVKQLTTKKVTALTQPILTATPITKAASPLKISASTTIIKEQEAPLTSNQQHINQQRSEQKLQIAPQSKQQAASIIDSITEQQSASITTEAYLLEVIQPDYQQAKTRHQHSIKNHLSTDDALLKEFIFNQNMINLPALIPKKITNSKPSKKVKNISSSSGGLDDDGLNENSVLTSIASTLPINNPAQIIRNNKIKIIAKKPPEQASMSRSEPKKINAKSTDKLTALQEAVAISGKKPKYPQRAALRQQKGQVKATMIVMKNGQTMGVKLTTSSGHEMLDKAVLNFIENERFMPALKGQDKISSEQSYSFSYQ
ncbi:energy transducer TonB [uncultured Psychromonas sp.]|uniref:energy transducer TonB n=1 Tax=uncultured Psychromonas sp. TaxID=173974 RepID=UPI00261B06AD|nr:energy transducer TonB [uncultured Psychromonas sp.]